MCEKNILTCCLWISILSRNRILNPIASSVHCDEQFQHFKMKRLEKYLYSILILHSILYTFDNRFVLFPCLVTNFGRPKFWSWTLTIKFSQPLRNAIPIIDPSEFTINRKRRGHKISSLIRPSYLRYIFSELKFFNDLLKNLQKLTEKSVQK